MRHRFLLSFAISGAAVLFAAGCTDQGTPSPTGIPTAEPVFPDFKDPALVATPESAELLGDYHRKHVILAARGAVLSSTQLAGTANPPGWRFFEFDGTQRADGSVRGAMYYRVKVDPGYTGDVRQWGTISCINSTTLPGTVFIAAHGTRRVGADLPPAFIIPTVITLPAATDGDDGMFFAVQDNGHGWSGPPDKFTAVIHTTTAVADGICAAPPAPLLAVAPAFFNAVPSQNAPVAWGYIRVRP